METKICTKCKKELPLDAFRKRKDSPIGHQSWCKECRKQHHKVYFQDNFEHFSDYNKSKRRLNHSAAIEAEKNYRNKNKEKFRQIAIKYRYKLTPAQIEFILKSQNGKCACCDATAPSAKSIQWCIDHDHKCCSGQKTCGKCIRGLLCHSCNLMLGRVKDNIQILKNFITYLERGVISVESLTGINRVTTGT